jgi:Coenzyme PQQ synthesis protein D (PqqD)
MFEWLKKFKKILVTGPQRSGTRICARMIAHDTGYKYIDEKVLGVDSFYKLFSLFDSNLCCVVQCPALCRHVHMFSRDESAIVLMRRNVKDIIASQERIGWNWEKPELARYDCSAGVIAEVKYEFWDKEQRPRIEHSFEIAYDSLAGHPLWVPKNMRGNFGPDQTESKKDNQKIDFKNRPCKCPNISCYEKIDSKEIVLVKMNGSSKLLNATGRLVWELSDGFLTLDDMLQIIKERFENVEEQVLVKDLDKFVRDLVSQGFFSLL